MVTVNIELLVKLECILSYQIEYVDISHHDANIAKEEVTFLFYNYKVLCKIEL